MWPLKSSLSLLKSLEKLVSISSASVSLSQKFLYTALKYSIIRASSNSFYHCKNEIVTLELVFYEKEEKKTPHNSFQEINQNKFQRTFSI